MLTIAGLLWFFFPFAAASAASERGHNAIGGFLLGLLFGPLGWLHMLLSPIGTTGDYRACAHCREPARRTARICPHCQKDIHAGPVSGLKIQGAERGAPDVSPSSRNPFTKSETWVILTLLGAMWAAALFFSR